MQPFRLDKKTLEKAINKAGATRQVKAAQICDLCDKLIIGINKKSADNVRAFSYKNKILTVLVSSSGWASEIQMSSHKIIEDINSKFGKELVTRIQFKVAN
jgi:predicted nucleic acid-binding Zn ribbon protein